MAEEYYKTLGVERDASPEAIQKAYRELARKYHPDLNRDNASAKKKFQEVQAAFDVLNDPKSRQEYDQFGSGFGSRPQSPWGAQGPAQFDDLDLSDLFGQGGAGGGGFADLLRGFGRGRETARPQAPRPQKGANLSHELTVPFNTVVVGGEAQVTVQRKSGKREAISVQIPAGIEDGKKIRLRGQGEPGTAGGAAGDILIQVRVASHPNYQRRGNQLDVVVSVTLAEAVVGAKIDLPTPKGTITLSVPPGTSSGTKLRIKGHGIAPSGKPPGDLFAEIQIVLPKELDADDWIMIKKLDARHPLDPRKDLKW